MKRKITLTLTVLFICLFSVLCCTACFEYGSVKRRPREITVLSYNVENLFDEVKDGSEYDDYDPEKGVWNDRLFHAKMNNLSRVIRSVGPKGPDIVALQEVENARTLHLLNNDYLHGMGYRYELVAEDSDAAVHVCFLSRYEPLEVSVHELFLPEIRGLREIMEVHFRIDDVILILFNCHWKSKSGGAEETEPIRVETAAVLLRRVRELAFENPDAEILIMGDLNENPDEYSRVDKKYQTALILSSEVFPQEYEQKSMLVTYEQSEVLSTPHPGIFYSPWGSIVSGGSYFYRGEWERIDHMLLTDGLLDEKDLSYASFHVVAEDFMLNGSGTPERWNTGTGSGYSDHLPLFIGLRLME